MDLGRMYENAVFLELMRRGCETTRETECNWNDGTAEPETSCSLDPTPLPRPWRFWVMGASSGRVRAVHARSPSSTRARYPWRRLFRPMDNRITRNRCKRICICAEKLPAIGVPKGFQELCPSRDDCLSKRGSPF